VFSFSDSFNTFGESNGFSDHLHLQPSLWIDPHSFPLLPILKSGGFMEYLKKLEKNPAAAPI
jgi:hypothetical protein